MIHELLAVGKENARTGRDISKILNTDIRTITEQIEAERRNGYPICANMSGENAGYFIAETPEELQEYCNRLYKRGGELFKTRRALLAALKKLQEQKEATK